MSSYSRPSTVPANVKRPPTSPGRPLAPLAGHASLSYQVDKHYFSTDGGSSIFNNEESLAELRDKIRRHHRFDHDEPVVVPASGAPFSTSWVGSRSSVDYDASPPKATRTYQTDSSLIALLSKTPPISNQQHGGRSGVDASQTHTSVSYTPKRHPSAANDYSAFSIGGASKGRIDSQTPLSAAGRLHPTSVTAAKMNFIREGLYEYSHISTSGSPSRKEDSRRLTSSEKYMALHGILPSDENASWQTASPAAEGESSARDLSAVVPDMLIIEEPQCTMGLLGEIEQKQIANRSRQIERYRTSNIEKWASVALDVMDDQLTVRPASPPGDVLGSIHAYIGAILDDLAGPIPTHDTSIDEAARADLLDATDPQYRFEVFQHTLKRKLGILDETGQERQNASSDTSSGRMLTPSSSRLSAVKKFVIVLMHEYSRYIRYLTEGNSLSAAAVLKDALRSAVEEQARTQQKLNESEGHCATTKKELEEVTQQLTNEKKARDAVEHFCDELKVTLAAYANEALPTDALARISSGSPTRHDAGSVALSPYSSSVRPYVEAVRAFSAEVAELRLHNMQLVEESNAVLETLADRERELAGTQERLLQGELKIAQLKASLLAVKGYCATLETNVNRLWARESRAVANANAASVHGATRMLLESNSGASLAVGSMTLTQRAAAVPVGGAALPLTYAGIVGTATPEETLAQYYLPPAMSQRHLKNTVVELLTEYVATIQNSIYASQSGSRLSSAGRILLSGAPDAVLQLPADVRSNPKWLSLKEDAENVARDIASVTAKVTTSMQTYTVVFSKRKNRLATDAAAAHQAQQYLNLSSYYAECAPAHTNDGQPLGGQLTGVKFLRGPTANADLSFFIKMYKNEIPSEAWHVSCNRVMLLRHALLEASAANLVAGGAAGAKSKTPDRLPRAHFLKIVVAHFPTMTAAMVDSLAAFSVILQQQALLQPQVAGLGEGSIPTAAVLKACLAADDITVEAFFERVNPNYDPSGPLSTSTSAATNTFFKGDMAASDELSCGRPPMALMTDYLLTEIALRCGLAYTAESIAVAVALETQRQACTYLEASKNTEDSKSDGGATPRKIDVTPLRSHYLTDHLTTISIFDVGRVLWSASAMPSTGSASSPPSGDSITLFKTRLALLLKGAVVVDPKGDEAYSAALEAFEEHMEAVEASRSAVDARGKRLPPMEQTLSLPDVPMGRIFTDEDVEEVTSRLLQSFCPSQDSDAVIEVPPSDIRVDPNVVASNARQYLFLLPPLQRPVA